MMDKQTLRSSLRTLATELLTPSARKEWSEAICCAVRTSPLFINARRVALFCALPDEPDLSALLNEYCTTKELYLPRVEGEHTMSFYRYYPGTLRQQGKFNIFEPTADASEAVDPQLLDLILVPGLAFDTQGHRMGRGKGFYDHYLSHTEAHRMAISFDFRLRSEVPTDPWDKPMQSIVTESGIEIF